MSAANMEIQKAKEQYNVFNWQIADELHCHENTIIRQLRHELSADQKQMYLQAIDNIVKTRRERDPEQ